MNTNLLKAKSLSKEKAYILFFVFQAPYAYVGKKLMQILYWFISIVFFGHLFMAVNGNIESVIPLCLAAIWPINQFFAIPNKIKKHNLKIYEELLAQE